MKDTTQNQEVQERMPAILASKRPRPIAIGLIRRDDEILVFKITDKLTGAESYRPLGGGIEYGEKSEVALVREFMEEIQAKVRPLRLLTIVERIFEREAQQRHQYVFLYEAEFENPSFYKKDIFLIHEPYDTTPSYGIWISIEKCKNGELTVAPSEVLDYV